MYEGENQFRFSGKKRGAGLEGRMGEMQVV